MSSRRGSLSDSLASCLSTLSVHKPSGSRSPRGSLSLLPNAVRVSTLKRHSLASVELATWTARAAANRRGSAFTLPFTSSLSPVEAVPKSETLEGVQAAIIRLFQRKPLKEQEMGTLQETVRTLSQAEVGSLIHEYYKDQLMKKGMVILREKIKNEQGEQLMAMLGETWDYFFMEILPTLQALMYPLAEVMADVDIRNTTLLEFRNIVVLKVGLKEAVESKKYQVTANIRQMLLVLQGLRDPTFLSKEQLDLEKMTACVIVPFLGTRGLYHGTPDPVTRANYRPPMPQLPVSKPNITITVCEDGPHQGPLSSPGATSSALTRLEQKHPIASPAAMRKRLQPPPSPSASTSSASPSSPTYQQREESSAVPRLKPVIEGVPDLPMGRRHSIVGT